MQISTKNLYKLGQMVIDQKQVFWKMKYCYALIPIVQLLDGHILLTSKRQVLSYTQLQPVQIFDLTLTTKFLSRAFENYYTCSSTTIYIQNSDKQSPLKQMIIHLIPRKPKDLQKYDLIYKQLEAYPKDLVTHYNQKMNFYINAYANKILQGIYQQNKKYQTHLDACYKEEKQN